MISEGLLIYAHLTEEVHFERYIHLLLTFLALGIKVASEGSLSTAGLDLLLPSHGGGDSNGYLDLPDQSEGSQDISIAPVCLFSHIHTF